MKDQLNEFTFDRVFGPNSTQKDVFDGISGYLTYQGGQSQTLIAYGHTASGKTHTVFGSNNWLPILSKARNGRNYFGTILRLLSDPLSCEFGLAQRILDHLFKDPQVSNISLSFFQIYTEQVIDLLAIHQQKSSNFNTKNPEAEETKIYQTSTDGVVVSGISEWSPQSLPEAVDYVRLGCLQRKVRDNSINRYSSRSHTILRITIYLQDQTKVTRLNIVDLAGSERYQEEGVMSKLHHQEQKSINQSLSTLSKVILQLNNGNYNHIHFRESKLTRILKDSLEGHSNVVLMANLAPVKLYEDESLRTLQFARQCTKLNSKIVDYTPEKHKESPEKLAQFYRKELDYYKSLLQLKRSAISLQSNMSHASVTEMSGLPPQALSEKVQKLEAERMEFKKVEKMYVTELLTLQKENAIMKQKIQGLKSESPKSSLLVQTSRDGSVSSEGKYSNLRRLGTKDNSQRTSAGFKILPSIALNSMNDRGLTDDDEPDPSAGLISGGNWITVPQNFASELPTPSRLTQEPPINELAPTEVDHTFYQNYLKIKTNLEMLHHSESHSPLKASILSPRQLPSPLSTSAPKKPTFARLQGLPMPLRSSVSNQHLERTRPDSKGLMSVWTGDDVLPLLKRRRMGKIPASFLVRNPPESSFFALTGKSKPRLSSQTYEDRYNSIATDLTRTSPDRASKNKHYQDPQTALPYKKPLKKQTILLGPSMSGDVVKDTLAKYEAILKARTSKQLSPG